MNMQEHYEKGHQIVRKRHEKLSQDVSYNYLILKSASEMLHESSTKYKSEKNNLKECQFLEYTVKNRLVKIMKSGANYHSFVESTAIVTRRIFEFLYKEEYTKKGFHRDDFNAYLCFDNINEWIEIKTKYSKDLHSLQHKLNDNFVNKLVAHLTLNDPTPHKHNLKQLMAASDELAEVTELLSAESPYLNFLKNP